MEPTDRELMSRMACGDGEALAPLVERYYQRLYRIAVSYLRDRDEALDVVQETFVRAYQHASSWNASSEVAPWLMRIAVNHAIDRCRRRKRGLALMEPLAEGDHDTRVAAEDPSPERQVLGREVSERLGQALRSLPDTQRAVFVLRHYQDMSLEEIAQTLGVRLGTVKSSLHRAIQRLRPRLRELRA